MIKTLAAALVAAGILGAPAFAQGNAADTAPVAMHHGKAVRYTAAVKMHKAKTPVALHHRKHIKHVKQVRHVKYHVKGVKHHARTFKHQARGVKHRVKKAG